MLFRSLQTFSTDSTGEPLESVLNVCSRTSPKFPPQQGGSSTYTRYVLHHPCQYPICNKHSTATTGHRGMQYSTTVPPELAAVIELLQNLRRMLATLPNEFQLFRLAAVDLLKMQGLYPPCGMFHTTISRSSRRGSERRKQMKPVSIIKNSTRLLK